MIYNTGYEAILAGFIAAFMAQLIKFSGYIYTHKTVNFKILTTTGGMPSSHTAGVVAVATVVGLLSGFESVVFAVAFTLATVVMYDAAGLRRSAGKMAATLNKMIIDIYEHKPHHMGPKLKELLGHTPIEVFVGALLGIAIAVHIHVQLGILTA